MLDYMAIVSWGLYSSATTDQQRAAYNASYGLLEVLPGTKRMTVIYRGVRRLINWVT